MEIIRCNKFHKSDRSYEMVLVKHNNTKLKMTYECYNGVERFTGELFVNGEWKHFFNMWDLGVQPDSARYVQSDIKRESVCEDLQKRGIEFLKLFNI